MKLPKNSGSIRAGLAGGGILSLLLWLPKIAGETMSISYRYAIYLALAIVLWAGLRKLASRRLRVFQPGLVFGLKASAISAIVVILINTVVYAIEPAISLSKFTLLPTEWIELLALDMVMFLEILVFGMLSTFIFLQLNKRSSRPQTGQ